MTRAEEPTARVTAGLSLAGADSPGPSVSHPREDYPTTRVRVHTHTHTRTRAHTGRLGASFRGQGAPPGRPREAHGQRPEQLLQGSGLCCLTQQAFCWETLGASSQTWRLHRAPTPAVSRSCEDLKKVRVPR